MILRVEVPVIREVPKDIVREVVVESVGAQMATCPRCHGCYENVPPRELPMPPPRAGALKVRPARAARLDCDCICASDLCVHVSR